MSKSPPITITGAELRSEVEKLLDRRISDEAWKNGETYARRKLEIYRERWPDVTHYDNDYLVMLTADTVREAEFADAITSISANAQIIVDILMTRQ